METQLPDLELTPSFDNLKRVVITEVFQRLRALDLEKARAIVLAGTQTLRTTERDDESPLMSVMASDGPVLTVMVGIKPTTYELELHIDPAKLDRNIPDQEQVYDACAAIVGFMQEAPETGEDDHAVFGPFEFWNAESQGDPANWKALAEIWGVATK